MKYPKFFKFFSNMVNARNKWLKNNTNINDVSKNYNSK